MAQISEDNFIVDHLVATDNAYRASTGEVLEFMNSYFSEMYKIDKAYEAEEEISLLKEKLLFVQATYWKTPTAFSDYWRPSPSWPSPHDITQDRGFCVMQDMIGNFVVSVGPAPDGFNGAETYLVSAVGDELRIVNKFF